MTSIAETSRGSRRPSRSRTLLVIAGLSLGAASTPMPWGGLWLIVPGAVAVSLLTAWRFGGWGVLVPVALFVASLLLVGNDQVWAWWIPFAALTGAWMGLREEGGGPAAGDRAWMLVPLLLLAATLPWTAPYEDFRATVGAWLDRQPAEARETLASRGGTEDVVRGLTLLAERHALLLPSVLFGWMVLLVMAGRLLSARAAASLRWPALSRARRGGWRLPDTALWLLLAGLALVVSPWPAWAPTGWTLLIGCSLGFCVQGTVVVESLLLARGVPPSIIMLTLLFVFAFTGWAYVLITASLGVSDVWLDFRGLEAPPGGDPPPA